jgi:hypothetical protein
MFNFPVNSSLFKSIPKSAAIEDVVANIGKVAPTHSTKKIDSKTVFETLFQEKFI